MNINDLKAGDRVKYNCDINPFIGNILELTDKKCKVTVNNEYLEPRWIRKEQIISKLEPLPLQYREIPMNKEEESYWIPVNKITKHVYSIPVTTYHCPKCDKQLWGSPGISGKQYDTEPCQECKDKGKSAPKSFKFDISFVNRVEFNQEPYIPHQFPSCYFKIEGFDIKYHPNNPDIWKMNGKTYTIEIKEKQ